MSDKKLITLEGLDAFGKKLKTQVINKNGSQTLDGSLTTTGDITVQGNLNVKGTTNTVDQETLTVKDNLIAINSDGTTLAASGKAGIVIVDGKERSLLISDYYEFDIETLLNFVNLRVVNISKDPDKVIYSLKTDPDIFTLFDSFNLIPTELKLQNGNNITDSFSNFFIGGLPGSYNNTASLNIVTNGDKTYSNILISVNLDENSGTYSIVDNKTQFLLSSTILSDKNIDDLSHFLKHSSSQKYINEENIKKEATAYAAPIYDVESDTLKIGLGSYEKDENGNIANFTFGGGQGQSIATRSDDLGYQEVPIWDEASKKFVKSNVSASSHGLIIHSERDTDSSNIPLSTSYGYNSIHLYRGDYNSHLFYFPSDRQGEQTLATQEWVDEHLDNTLKTTIDSTFFNSLY